MKGATASNNATPTNSSVGPTTYLQKMTQTDYMAGGFQYKDEVIEFIPHAEGFVKSEKGSYVYYFNYTDHLGNVRVTYTDDGSGTPYVVEESNYYPFGLKHRGYNEPDQNLQDWGNILTTYSSLNHKYKYNGKEFQDELGLNMYDYGARNYDAAIGRWMNIDPLAELSRRWSPYTYAKNNPMFFIDPDGMLDTSFIQELWDKSSNNTTWTNNNDGSFSGKDNDEEDSETTEDSENNDGDPKKNGSSKSSNKSSNKTVLNWFDKNISPALWDTAENEETELENVLILYTHGNQQYIVGPNGEKIYNAKQLNAILSKSSTKWAEFLKNGGKFTLVLKSCKTGHQYGEDDPKSNQNVARKFSKINGLTVIAPTGYFVGTSYLWGLFTTQHIDDPEGVNQWNAYYNNKRIKQFND
ncbi:RHS repeat-associated core domain-containing protein [Flavobacterium amniphilum]|uniref:RHS repeat domain-containing protein n=1 Tax=Flavobacterium amniphilum TaxID=1834035 RepID=UPI00202A0544|nr:RHS repeat-associated core domain-containing protein [Flavobacterium amniphilum]MCL9805466.1 RHS repeat-associated core domain-containing protein [Flavobacterium amniphilum]